MARSDALKKAQAKYNKEKTKAMCIKLHLENDADIIRKLEEVKSKQGYIKDLIRKDMKK